MAAKQKMSCCRIMHRPFPARYVRMPSTRSDPFWFGWSTVLFSKNMHWNPTGLNTIHTSSVSAWARWLELCVHIRGQWMVQKISNSEQYLNWVIGGIFLLTASSLSRSCNTRTAVTDRGCGISGMKCDPLPDHRAQGRSD